MGEEFWSMTADQSGNLRRRTVLALAVAAAGFATTRVQLSAESVSAALHRLLGRSSGVRAFGRVVHGRRADAATDLLALLDGLDGSVVRSRLAELRAEDFAAGRVEVIDGWVLARTEAEACAVVFLA